MAGLTILLIFTIFTIANGFKIYTENEVQLRTIMQEASTMQIMSRLENDVAQCFGMAMFPMGGMSGGGSGGNIGGGSGGNLGGGTGGNIGGGVDGGAGGGDVSPEEVDEEGRKRIRRMRRARARARAMRRAKRMRKI